MIKFAGIGRYFLPLHDLWFAGDQGLFKVGSMYKMDCKQGKQIVFLRFVICYDTMVRPATQKKVDAQVYHSIPVKVEPLHFEASERQSIP